MARAGESHKKTSEVAQVAIRQHSEHHDVFIGCQHHCYLYNCLGQETGTTLTLGTTLYHLQRVWFVASGVSIFAALPRTMNRSNAKLNDDMNGLF